MEPWDRVGCPHFSQGPAVAVVAGGVPYLVDCGPGVVRRATAAHIKASDLKCAFITHLHSDHTTGLADLILAPWTLERTDPLELYGPPGIRSMAAHILAAYREDIRVRLNGGEPSNKTGYKVNAHEIRAGVVYRDANVTVTAFSVPHGDFRDAFGYRFDTSDGRSIVISGDTGPTDAVVKAWKKWGQPALSTGDGVKSIMRGIVAPWDRVGCPHFFSG